MSASEFFRMGGYAFYVWTSYGLALIVLLANLLGAWLRHRDVRRRRAFREDS
jgi:heme exporter protein D